MAILKHEAKRSEPALTTYDRLFDWPEMFPAFFGRRWMPEEVIHVDEYQENGTLVVKAELPGIDPDKDVELTVSDGTLHIEAQRREEERSEEKGYVRKELRYGSFARTLRLPEGVSEEDIQASYKDGILGSDLDRPGTGGAHTDRARDVEWRDRRGPVLRMCSGVSTLVASRPPGTRAPRRFRRGCSRLCGKPAARVARGVVDALRHGLPWTSLAGGRRPPGGDRTRAAPRGVHTGWRVPCVRSDRSSRRPRERSTAPTRGPTTAGGGLAAPAGAAFRQMVGVATVRGGALSLGGLASVVRARRPAHRQPHCPALANR